MKDTPAKHPGFFDALICGGISIALLLVGAVATSLGPGLVFNVHGSGAGPFHFGHVEFRQHVAGKHRLDPPDLAAAGGLAVAQAGTKDLDSLDFPQVAGSDVLAFRLATNAEPLGLIRDGGTHWPRSF